MRFLFFFVVFLYGFDEKLYEYMYKSFIYSNDVKDAYIVAKKVLELNSSNIIWRERVAKLAWTLGKSKEAYNNFLFVYRKTHSKKIRKVLFLFPYEKSIELKKKFYEKEVRKGNFSYVIDLAHIYIKLGYPEKAFRILNIAYNREKKEEFLKEFIKVAVSLDDIVDILIYFEKIKKFNLNMRIDIAKELVNFNLYGFAFNLLKDVKELPKNRDYYKYMVYITYKLGYIKKMMLLLDYLLYSGELKKEGLNILMNYYLSKGKYRFLEFLFSNAIKHNKSYVANYIEILKLEGKYKKLILILNKYKNYLAKKYYFYTLGYSYWKLGFLKKASKIFENLVKSFRLTNVEISSILWFAIDNNDYKLFKIVENLIKGSKYFDYQLMIGYFKFNELDKAYYKGISLLKNNLDNVDFLLTFSDILNSLGRDNYFYILRAWNILSKKLNRHPNLLYNKDFFQNYFRLAIYFLDGNEMIKLLKIGKKILSKEEYLNLEFSYYFNFNINRCLYIKRLFK